MHLGQRLVEAGRVENPECLRPHAISLLIFRMVRVGKKRLPLSLKDPSKKLMTLMDSCPRKCSYSHMPKGLQSISGGSRPPHHGPSVDFRLRESSFVHLFSNVAENCSLSVLPMGFSPG